MPKTTSIGFRPSPELREALKRASEADKRSMSSLLHKIASEWCEANGWVEPGGTSAAQPRKAKRKGAGERDA